MIIVNAKLDVKEGKIDEVINLSKDLLRESKEHEGNISYNLFCDVESNELCFVEKWESKEALQKHMKEEVFLKFGQSMKDLLKSELEAELYLADKIQ